MQLVIALLNTSTSWNGLFISTLREAAKKSDLIKFQVQCNDGYRRPSRAAAVSRGSSMRRTASSTASLQHRDTTIAVLNSARLNEEAPQRGRPARSSDAF